MHDEIARHLRDRVPDPSETYWDDIDAAINEDNGEIINGPVRLTDMTKKSSRRSILFSTAAALLVVCGGVALLNRSGDTTNLTAAQTPTTQSPTATTAFRPTTSTTAGVDSTKTEGTTIAPTTTTSGPTSIILSTFAVEDVERAEVDAIGCWFEIENNPNSFDPVFFAGENQGFLRLKNGDEVLLAKADSDIIDFGARTHYSSDAVQVTITELSVAVATSNESNLREVSISFSIATGDESVFSGQLECGV